MRIKSFFLLKEYQRLATTSGYQTTSVSKDAVSEVTVPLFSFGNPWKNGHKIRYCVNWSSTIKTTVFREVESHPSCRERPGMIERAGGNCAFACHSIVWLIQRRTCSAMLCWFPMTHTLDRTTYFFLFSASRCLFSQVNPEAASFYEAVILYVTALSEALKLGHSPTDGSVIHALMRNRTLPGKIWPHRDHINKLNIWKPGVKPCYSTCRLLSFIKDGPIYQCPTPKVMTDF